MYKVKIMKDFSSAHNLRGYEGNCENLHGHNWKVQAVLKGEQLDHIGMLVDFKVFKKVLKEILDGLDHKYLNDVKPFDTINPTSENIARYIFEELDGKFPGRPDSVTVYENDDACAEYSKS